MNTLSIEPNQTFTQDRQTDHAPGYLLKWRQKQLLVRLGDQVNAPYLPALENPQQLVECLKHSPVEIVSLTPEIGEAKLTFWANACEQAGKMMFIRVPSTPELPNKKAGIRWSLKRFIDRGTAALLLLLLSPVLLGLALLIMVRSPGPVFFTQWRVGERGKLFRILKFRTMGVGAEHLHHQVMGQQTGLHKHTNDPRVTPLGRWMRKYSLDELPQLLNVLRGEMSFVGPRPWALYDAVRISPAMQHRLNALPGITGVWQVAARSKMRDIDAVNRCDLSYLSSWSLGQDFQILLQTVPKVLSGFGAY